MANLLIASMENRLREIQAELDEIPNQAEREKRAITKTENARIDALLEERTAGYDRLEVLESLEARAQAAMHSASAETIQTPGTATRVWAW